MRRSSPEERLRSVRARSSTVAAELIEPGPARDEVNLRPIRHGPVRACCRRTSSDWTGRRRRPSAPGSVHWWTATSPMRCPSVWTPECGCGSGSPSTSTWTSLSPSSRQDAAPVPPPIVADGGRLYVGYHGFRDPRLLLPDALFRLTSTAATAVAERLEIIAVGWDREETSPCLTLAVLGPLDLMGIGAAPPRVTVGGVPAEVSMRAGERRSRTDAHPGSGGGVAGPVRTGRRAVGTVGVPDPARRRGLHV